MHNKIPHGSKIIGRKYGRLVWKTPDNYKLMTTDSNMEPESISRYNKKLGSRLDLKSDFIPDKNTQIVELTSPAARFDLKLDSTISPSPQRGNTLGRILASGDGADDVKNDSNLPDYNMTAGKKTGMAISSRGVRFLQAREGFKPYLHDDAAGHCSIGWGKLVHHGNCNGTDPKEQPYLNGITAKEARKQAEKNISEAEMSVNELVNVRLNQDQFDALTSFVYNLGKKKFQKSTLRKVINEGKFDEVPYQLNRWRFADKVEIKGIKRRRGLEGKLFTGSPDSDLDLLINYYGFKPKK